jgi:hypothetical protein
VEIRPDPMHDLLEVRDQSEHQEHRFHQHAVLPLAALTQFEVAGIPLRGMEGGVAQDNHVLFEQLYATLGEQATLVQEGMSLPPDPAKVTLASTAHSLANSARAAQLNMQYQQDLARWQALLWRKRLRVKKPTRPTGV